MGATDDGFAERMQFYVRATLLDEVIDGLAEHVGLDATDEVEASIRQEKLEAFEKGFLLYRERYPWQFGRGRTWVAPAE